MAVADTALLARARGLATRLLRPSALQALAEAPDLASFARGLSRLDSGIEPAGEPLDVANLDRAFSRTAARHLELLRRWQSRTPGPVDVFIADQERRSLRALLRGAIQGTPAATRLAGLIATPGLSERWLAELAHQPSPLAVVSRLSELGYPDASRLLPIVSRAQPDAFAIEGALLQGLVARASSAARAGDEVLKAFVCERVDVGNAQNALLLAGEPPDTARAPAFVPGGRWLSAVAFTAAASSASRPRAQVVLTTALAGSPLSRMLPVVVDDASHLERAFLIEWLRRLAHECRVNPLSTAPILRVLVAIQAESHNLRSLAWGVALGTPSVTRTQALVAP